MAQAAEKHKLTRPHPFLEDLSEASEPASSGYRYRKFALDEETNLVVRCEVHGFVPVKDLPAAEQLPAAPLVIGAYAFIWIGVMAYLWTIWRRLSAVDRELAQLRQTIERR